MVRIATLLIFLIFNGCTTFHPKPLSPAQTASQFESRSLDNPELKNYLEKILHQEICTWPLQQWNFRMLALASFFYNQNLEIVKAHWEVTKAGIVTAQARPNPSLNLNPQYSTNILADALSPWTIASGIEIPIQTAGKRRFSINEAKHLSNAAKLNIISTAWQEWSNLKKGLLGLYNTTVKDSILQCQFAIENEIVKLFEQRFSVGEISSLDFNQSHPALNNAQSVVVSNQKAIYGARYAMAQAIGVPVEALDCICVSFDIFEQIPGPVNIDDARKTALLSRSDILSSLSEYEVTQSALQLEIARQYPDFNPLPGYEYDQGENRWGLGLTIQLPVFNRNQGPIKEAQARREEAAARFMALQANIIRQIELSHTAYTKSLEILHTADSLLSIQKKTLQDITDRFNTGESDRLALDQSKSQFYSTVLSHFDALIVVQQNLIDLENALQTPLIPLECSTPNQLK